MARVAEHVAGLRAAMSDGSFSLVGLMSSYREGRLTVGALRSLREIEPDALIVYDGPAGPELDGPESDLPEEGGSAVAGEFWMHTEIVHHGRWRTDARKRQAMLERAQGLGLPGPLWGLWLDGDEILVNGAYVRDIVQARVWEDELAPEDPPWARWPLRLVEADGAVATIPNRLVRLDLIREYVVSTSRIVNSAGIEEGWANTPQDSNLWLHHFLGAVDKGRMVAWPPLPCEPHIFHRSGLRHPSRRGRRLHQQEAAEFARIARERTP